MFIEDLIQGLSYKIEVRLNEDILINLQEYLLRAGIFTVASNLLATLIFVIVLFSLFSILISFLFSLDLLISLSLAILGPIVFLIVIIDYLHGSSSLLLAIQ